MDYLRYTVKKYNYRTGEWEHETDTNYERIAREVASAEAERNGGETLITDNEAYSVIAEYGDYTTADYRENERDLRTRWQNVYTERGYFASFMGDSDEDVDTTSDGYRAGQALAYAA